MDLKKLWVCGGCFFIASLAQALNGSDFSGDGTNDLAVYKASSADWIVPDAGINLSWGWNETHPVPGDYDNDSVADLAVYHRQSGKWYIRTKAGNVLAWGLSWGYQNAHALGAGDYNGDGRDDLALYDPFTTAWFVRSLSGDVIAWNRRWGVSHFQPVPGDYDGDGTTDLAMYDRFGGKWYILSLKKGVIGWGISWGFRDARPVPGDFNGDGISDLAVYHRPTGKWYIRTMGGSVLAWGAQWGFASARSVPGDFDGDNKDDLAVYYAPTGAWYVYSLDKKKVISFGRKLGGADFVPVTMYGHGGEGHVILAHGDSLTYGRGSSSNGPKTSYPAFLDHHMESALGGMSFVINAGVPGETTFLGRRRLTQLLDKHKPSILLMMEGTNDLYYDYPASSTLNNLAFMANGAKNRGASVVMATLPPMISRPWDNRDAQHARARAINPFIRTLANQLGWPCAEVYQTIALFPNWPAKLFSPIEALHPNDTGYRLIRDEMIRSIKRGVNEGRFAY